MTRPAENNIWQTIFSPLWQRPKRTLIVMAVVVTFALFGALRLRPAANMDFVFNSHDPASQAMAHVLQDFKATDQLILLVSQRLQEPQRLLDFAGQLDHALLTDERTTPYCARVTYRADEAMRQYVQQVIVPSGLYYLDDQAYEDFVHRLTPAAMTRQMQLNEAMLASPAAGAGDMARTLLRDPLRLREFLAGEARAASDARPTEAFLTRDGRMLLIQIAGRRPTTDLDFAKQMVESVTEVAQELNTQGLTLRLTGGYAIATTAAGAIRRDMIVSVVSSIIIVQILFWLMYVRPWLLGVAIMPVACGIVTAFGLASLWNMQLTPLVAVIGGLMAGLGVDYCIHFLSHYVHQRQEADSPYLALRATTRAVGSAMAGACVTSVIGFGAVLTAEAKALRDFALIGCVGLLCTMLVTFIVLPCVLTLMDRRKVDTSRPKKNVRVDPTELIRLVIARPKQVIAVSLSVMGLALGVLLIKGPVAFSTDLSDMHPRPNPALAAQQLASEQFGNTTSPLMVYLRAHSQPELVTLAHQVKRRLATAAVLDVGVVRSFGLADLLPPSDLIDRRDDQLKSIDPEQVLRDFNTAVEASAFTPDAFSEFASFLGRLLRPVRPPGQYDLRQHPTVASVVLPREEAQPNQAITFVWTRSPLWEIQKRREVIRALQHALAGLPDVTVTGMSVVSMNTHDSIRSALRTPLIFAGIAVVLWLLIWWRRPVDVLCAMLPVGFGGLVLMAWMQLTGDQLNMVNLICFPILVGIGVDDAIFLINSYRRHLQSPEQLLRSFTASAHAIIMTSLTTSAAFGSLTFTSTPAIQSLGRMMAIGVLACLFGALLLLIPTLIIRGGRTH